jgi:hypothetical protein
MQIRFILAKSGPNINKIDGSSVVYFKNDLEQLPQSKMATSTKYISGFSVLISMQIRLF